MHNSKKRYDDFPYLLDSETRKNLVEITDNNGLPFLLMPEHLVKKKKMHHRIIIVLLKDKKNRVLFVQKHSNQTQNAKNIWEFPCHGIVFAGESAEGTAYAELQTHFYIDDRIKMKEIATLPYLQDDIYVMATIFYAGPHYGTFRYNEDTVKDAMFVDKDEFAGLLAYDPDMFNPIIKWAHRANWIYK
jgi:NUDIX domain.